MGLELWTNPKDLKIKTLCCKLFWTFINSCCASLENNLCSVCCRLTTVGIAVVQRRRHPTIHRCPTKQAMTSAAPHVRSSCRKEPPTVTVITWLDHYDTTATEHVTHWDTRTAEHVTHWDTTAVDHSRRLPPCSVDSPSRWGRSRRHRRRAGQRRTCWPDPRIVASCNRWRARAAEGIPPLWTGQQL